MSTNQTKSLAVLEFIFWVVVVVLGDGVVER